MCVVHSNGSSGGPHYEVCTCTKKGCALDNYSLTWYGIPKLYTNVNTIVYTVVLKDTDFYVPSR